MIILDPESNSDGQMRIEPYSYGITNRRIFEITSKGEKDLFKPITIVITLCGNQQNKYSYFFRF